MPKLNLVLHRIQNLLLAGGLLVLAAVPMAVAAAPTDLDSPVHSAQLPQQLLGLPARARARIGEIPLDAGATRTVAVIVEKFSVFAADAAVIVNDGHGEKRLAPPAAAFFRGEIEGQPGSAVFLSMAENGQLRGILHLDGDVVITERAAAGGKLASTTSRRVAHGVDFAERSFQCQVASAHKRFAAFVGTPASSARTSATLKLNTTPYTARIAIDSDYEFYQRFGNSTAASQYIADLFGYISTVYGSELQTSLELGSLYLYSTSTDPWGAIDPLNALTEVGNYWQTNRAGVARTLVHFMSGKTTSVGGIAEVDALCSTSRGYGVSMGLQGSFSAASPQIIWDSVVVAHEIGHNFGSDHTHAYDNVGGNPSPVDCCASDADFPGGVCASQSHVLPGVGALTGGATVNRPGTIMSYCHTLGGGLGNISFTFGKNHLYGVAASRVPTVMRTAVEAAVVASPACFPANATAHTLTVSRSGAGGGAVNSTAPGISCGLDCSESYAINSSVTLTAAASPGAVFTGWSGACSGTGACTFSMNTDKWVEAAFPAVGTFPNGALIPAGWVQPVGSNAAWSVVSDSAYEGAYSLRSGSITNNQKSEIAYSGSFAAGAVRFARRVSSEANFDALDFYIDGVLQNRWDGEWAWSLVSFPLTAGAHTLLWRYFKDQSDAGGADAAWIDDVVFLVPPGAPILSSATRRTTSVSLRFSPPLSDGGSPVTSYTATCTAPAQTTRTASGSASPLSVSGLTVGVAYSCAVTASSIAGTGSVSSAIAVPARAKAMVTPQLMLLLD